MHPTALRTVISRIRAGASARGGPGSGNKRPLFACANGRVVRSLAGSPRSGQRDTYLENEASVHLVGQALGSILGGAGERGESPEAEKGGQGQRDTPEDRDLNGLNSNRIGDIGNIY